MLPLKLRHSSKIWAVLTTSDFGVSFKVSGYFSTRRMARRYMAAAVRNGLYPFLTDWREHEEAFRLADAIDRGASDANSAASPCYHLGHDWASKEDAYENNRPLVCVRCGTCGDV